MCWNINGVKQKFENVETQYLFKQHDIIIIVETHFVVRHKCPEGFKLIARSTPIKGAKRGGVAIYKRPTLDLKFREFKDVCPDAVVLLIEGTCVFIVAAYITPESTKYKFPGIFSLLEFIIKSLHGSVYLIGDLNSRCGTPAGSYTVNPDKGVNSYGKKMIEMCNSLNMIPVNGFIRGDCSFDSDYTFFRGKTKSQNDWCVTNSVQNITKFKILPRIVVSDHAPLSLGIKLPAPCTWQLLGMICHGNFSYDMYDRTNLLKRNLKLKDINPSMLVNKLNNMGDIYFRKLTRGNDINSVVIDLNEDLYNVCVSKIKERKTVVKHMIKKHLSSTNFKAIADANLHMYTLSTQRNDDAIISSTYFDTWALHSTYCRLKEKEEYNEKVNTTWRTLSKEDPRKLWKKINYKNDDSKMATESSSLDGTTVTAYFKKIFQADRLKDNPVVEDIEDGLSEYTMHVPLLDDCFTIQELNLAIAKNGNGSGIDGLDKKVALLFPMKLRLCILNIFNHIFCSQ